MREKKYVVVGALLSLLFTLALVGHLSGADPLQAFSQPAEHDVMPASSFKDIHGQSDGLESLLGPLVPKEDGFT